MILSKMDNTDIKSEFYTDYHTVSCCHACLSTGRRLSTVTDYVDIYYKVCDYTIMNPDTEVFLCWECKAFIRRLSIFTRKAAEAQRILHFYFTNRQDPFPKSLSDLTMSPTNNSQIHLTYEEKELKAIKQEAEQFDNDFDHFDYTDNVKDEPDDETNLETANIVEPKVENPKSPKSNWKEYNTKRIINRKAKYRFVNTNHRKHRRLLIRKIPMKLNEILAGLEEERCSVTFLEKEHKCVLCVAVWNDEDGLEKHNKKCHDDVIGPYQCNICHTRVPSQDKLQAHETKHYYRRECRVCYEQFCSQGSMDIHLEKHHRMVQCLACELCFNNVRLFYNHYKALHGVFVCDVCGKRCKTRDMIERHLRYHFGYECPYCKKTLKNSSSYKNHIETQHSTSVSEEAYCVQCDRKFTSNRMYKRHLQASAAHAGERDNTRVKRQYPCPECSNVYSRRTYMNNHYRHVHKKQSKYYCADCDRHFLNRTRYADHRRFQHEGKTRDKDKLCNICGRGFAANRTLINHIRTHSGERPFGCEYCGAKFTQKHAMLSHVKYVHLKSRRQSRFEEPGQKVGVEPPLPQRL